MAIIQYILSNNKGYIRDAPYWAPAFLYTAESLAILIKGNPNIHGVPIGDEEEKISQYADDTNLWSLYKENSINNIVKELEMLYDNTGLQVNYEKSTIFRIGAIKNTQCKLKLSQPFKWSNGPIDTLGIIANIDDLQELEAVNYEEVLGKIQRTLLSWGPRHLTLIGKIEICNVLICSTLIYKMQVLPTLSHALQKKLNDMLTNFIWNGKKPKIRLKTLTQDKQHGGRKLTDIKCRDYALKTEWIRRMCQMNDKTLTNLAYYFLNIGITNENFWECNMNVDDVKLLKIKNAFWEDMVKAWAMFNFKVPAMPEEIVNQPLWYNSLMKINAKLFFSKKMYDSGVFYVKDLYCDGKLMTYEQFSQIFECDACELHFNAVVSAMPKEWKKSSKKKEIYKKWNMHQTTQMSVRLENGHRLYIKKSTMTKRKS